MRGCDGFLYYIGCMSYKNNGSLAGIDRMPTALQPDDLHHCATRNRITEEEEKEEEEEEEETEETEENKSHHVIFEFIVRHSDINYLLKPAAVSPVPASSLQSDGH